MMSERSLARIDNDILQCHLSFLVLRHLFVRSVFRQIRPISAIYDTLWIKLYICINFRATSFSSRLQDYTQADNPYTA
jgi:hypothetical protein